ncbi:MAG: nucleotidyl transferase AbiEii/AbiGii toxin family protein [Bacteroidales bacterium]|nr:nucleotidyl transferase AbiEii/AbiGii toxin family protein [Bacteroidales bacterium]
MSKGAIMPLSARELNEIVEEFLDAAQTNDVRMILVGGGAVNFHGVQRHSADIDFWIDTSPENLEKLSQALKKLGYEFDKFPDSVYKQQQNISIHISPIFNIELITYLNFGVSFDEAFEKAEICELNKHKLLKFRVLSFNDLIESKIKSGRPKDHYDVLSLKEVAAGKK